MRPSSPKGATELSDPTDGEAVFRSVMTDEPMPVTTPFQATLRDFVFGQIWARPGLSRRDRRWVTLTCVAAADSPGPIDEHVYAALKSGDIELDAILEFLLHFAVYCGWPKASPSKWSSRSSGPESRKRPDASRSPGP